LIRLGSENNKLIGREIIVLLGKDMKNLNSIYSNRQNVHNTEVSESISNFIREISSIDVDNIKFDDIIKDIEKLYVLNKDKFEKIQTNNEHNSRKTNWDRISASLLRLIDNMTYEGFSITTIFRKIWKLIITNENSSILKTRLIEELMIWPIRVHLDIFQDLLCRERISDGR
jgi:DNA-binding transcriptional regulator YhcF (GntR family)